MKPRLTSFQKPVCLCCWWSKLSAECPDACCAWECLPIGAFPLVSLLSHNFTTRESSPAQSIPSQSPLLLVSPSAYSSTQNQSLSDKSHHHVRSLQWWETIFASEGLGQIHWNRLKSIAKIQALTFFLTFVISSWKPSSWNYNAALLCPLLMLCVIHSNPKVPK